MNHPPGDKLPEPWGTWIETRSPQFRMHDTLGKAKGALSYHTHGKEINGLYTTVFRGGVLYRYNGKQWIIVQVIHPGTTRDQYSLWTHTKQWIKNPGITTLIHENPY